jgi:hypothetical protein
VALDIFSIIELAGGGDDIKALFFPMALEAMPLQWFDKLNPGSIRGWEDLQRALCDDFAGIITHPITHAELKGLKQKEGKSFRDYYRRIGELRAQVHDITEREVIEAFSYRILAKWQFQDFCKENPQSNEEIKRMVERMITAEEKTRKRFPKWNNRDNSNRQNHQNNGHQDRKRGPDNNVAVADKEKKIFKSWKFDDLENMHYIWHLNGNHTTRNCRIFIDRYTRKSNKADIKEDNQKKDEDNHEHKGFQKSKGTVAVIFARVPGSRSKHQDKPALRTIMAAEPTTPRYLNWS